METPTALDNSGPGGRTPTPLRLVLYSILRRLPSFGRHEYKKTRLQETCQGANRITGLYEFERHRGSGVRLSPAWVGIVHQSRILRPAKRNSCKRRGRSLRVFGRQRHRPENLMENSVRCICEGCTTSLAQLDVAGKTAVPLAFLLS